MRRLAAANREIAFSLFANWAAARLRALTLGTIVLVPVPSSSCIAFDAVTTPVRMAQAVQPLLGTTCTVQSWLRFRQVMLKSHEGGTHSVNDRRFPRAVTGSKAGASRPNRRRG